LLASDIGKIAYQVDTKQYWRLLSTAPTWGQINPPTVVVVTTPTNPTGTTSTAGVAMGLNQVFTPIRSGTALVTVSGSVTNSAASGGSSMLLAYGSGTPPTNGLAGAGLGASLGSAIRAQNNASMAAAIIPFSISAVITGMTLGTAYWLDLILAAVTSGTATVSAINVTIIEL
jgi:hypothetical protein